MTRARALLSAACTAIALCGCVTPGDQAGPSAASAGAPLAFDTTRSAYDTANLRANVRPARGSLEGSIWMQADTAESGVRTGAGIVTDPELNAYVSGLVCKLAGPYCGEIRTYIVRVPDFNAFMMPNGAMIVWTGLLLRMRNEAQLATVLGHEIAHYLQRHGIQRMEDVAAKTNALIFVQMASIAVGVPAAGDLAALATLGAIQGFSRENESEADDVAMRLLVQHGYDPREASRIWEQVQEESKADKTSSRGSLFFASHPAPETRSDRLARQAAYALSSMPQPDLGRDRFRAAVRPHFTSFLRDEFRMRRMERLAVVLNQLARDETDIGTIKFFQGELHRVRNAANDNLKALEFYTDAIRAEDHPPEVYRSLGQAYQRAGQKREANEAFREYLRRVPDATDRGLIETMMGG